MQIEVTEETIEEYGLDILTGNSKEEMLKRAAEALESGYTLTVKIHDRVTDANIFDHFESRVVGNPDESGRFDDVVEGEIVEDDEDLR